jgi:hypothetical protein
VWTKWHYIIPKDCESMVSITITSCVVGITVTSWVKKWHHIIPEDCEPMVSITIISCVEKMSVPNSRRLLSSGGPLCPVRRKYQYLISENLSHGRNNHYIPCGRNANIYFRRLFL